MEQRVKERIARAKELLNTAKHAAMATVNADGTPHNSPFYLIVDETLEHIYFGSHPEPLHSQNVMRTEQMFVVVYDMIERGGLYMRAVNGRQLAGEELARGLAIHNQKRARDNKEPLLQSYYEGDNPQRMYGADLVGFWVNAAERGADGLIIRDYRLEVARSQLAPVF